MSRELLEAKQRRVAELQVVIQKSTDDFQQLAANHNALLGRLAEAQMDLEQLHKLCANAEQKAED